MPFELKKSMSMGELGMLIGLIMTALLWFFKTGGDLQNIIDGQRSQGAAIQSLQNQVKIEQDELNSFIRILDWNHIQKPPGDGGLP